MTEAIIFDFDGVLVSSDKPRFNVIQDTALSYSILVPNESIDLMIGRVTVDFLGDVLIESEKPLISKIIEEYEAEYKGNITKYVQPIDLTVNFVKDYNGPLALAIASTSSRAVIEELTSHFNISTKFRAVVSKEDVGKLKPDPEVYLKTAVELGIQPGRCTVIEDSLIGVQAAINANMRCFVLLNGFNFREQFSGLNVAGFINSEKDLLDIN